MTFFVLTCTVAVEDAAQNHSDSAQYVCQIKAAQISLVEVLQLEDILWLSNRKRPKNRNSNFTGNQDFGLPFHTLDLRGHLCFDLEAYSSSIDFYKFSDPNPFFGPKTSAKRQQSKIQLTKVQ